MGHVQGLTLKQLVRIPKDANDCWKWLGKETQDGYGIKVHNGKETTAARWIWCVLFGELPAALRVIHTCGNHGCVNPSHMRAGTQADACRSGVQSTLTPADVAEIKTAKKDRGPNTASALAARLGVQPGQVREIWKGTSWGKPGRRRGGNKVRRPVDKANGMP